MRRVTWFSMAILFCLANLGASPRPDRTKDRTEGKVPQKTAVTQSKPQTLKDSTQNPKATSQVGIASWYGRYFHGRLTASGEPYDMFQLTAAHRTLSWEPGRKSLTCAMGSPSLSGSTTGARC
jgi:hypothetical protein